MATTTSSTRLGHVPEMLEIRPGASAQKKQRQTRIPEHLKTVKNAHAKPQQLAKQLSRAALAMAAGKPGSPTKMEHIIAAQQQTTASTPTTSPQPGPRDAPADVPPEQSQYESSSAHPEFHAQQARNQTGHPEMAWTNSGLGMYFQAPPMNAIFVNGIPISSDGTPVYPARPLDANPSVHPTLSLHTGKLARSHGRRGSSSSSSAASSMAYSSMSPDFSPLAMSAQLSTSAYGLKTKRSGNLSMEKTLSSASLQSLPTSMSTFSLGPSTGSPPTPLSASCPLVLSMSSDGKACLTPSSLKSSTTPSHTPVPPSRIPSSNAMSRSLTNQSNMSWQSASRGPNWTAYSATADPLDLAIEMPPSDEQSAQRGFSTFEAFTTPIKRPSGPLASASASMTRSMTAPVPMKASKTLPAYPDKQQLQSTWKFPLGTASSPADTNVIGKHSGARPARANSDAMAIPAPSSAPLSSPSVASSNLAAYPLAPARESQALTGEPLRASRIQAWLDAPDMTVDAVDENVMSSIVRPEDVEGDRIEMPFDNTPLDWTPLKAMAINRSLLPGSTGMERSASAPMTTKPFADPRFRASGKTVHPLRQSRKRRLGEEGNDDSEDNDAPASPTKSTKSELPSSTKSSPKKNKSNKTTPLSSPRKADLQVKSIDHAATGTARTQAGDDEEGDIIACLCGKAVTKGQMVQCDDCASWFHLRCLKIDKKEVKGDWSCPRCVETKSEPGLAARPTTPVSSISSTMEAPSTPEAKIATGMQPTFSRTHTPHQRSRAAFNDSSLALAPSPGPNHLPSTPSSNHTRHVSRHYGPMTPQLGSNPDFAMPPSSGFTPRLTNTSSFFSAAVRTPSHSLLAYRSPNKHSRTSSTSFTPFRFDEPPSRDRNGQLDLYYADFTSPTGAPAHLSSSSDLLPAVDPEEVTRQRFLELNSTPSRWNDTPRFPDMDWL